MAHTAGPTNDFLKPMGPEFELKRFPGRTFFRLTFGGSGAAVSVRIVSVCVKLACEYVSGRRGRYRGPTAPSFFKSDLGTEANHIRSEPCVPGPCLVGPTQKSIALLRQKDRTSTDAFLLFAQGKGMIKGGAPAAGDAAGRRLYCIAHPVKVHP